MKNHTRFPKCPDEMEYDKEMSLKQLRKLKKARMTCEAVVYAEKSKFRFIETEYGRMVA